MGAGVQSVIAGLWDVDDKFGLSFMPLIHEGVSSGKSPSDALRGAQLKLLKSRDPDLRDPAGWGSFVTFGL